MKRIIAVMCMLAMMLTGITAFGEDMASALPEVTLKVKAALNIGDEYDEFVSNYYNNKWELSWNGDSKWLSVTCDDTGKIFNYYYYSEADYDSEVYEPRYPNCTADELKQLSEEFLEGVITSENEGWVLNDYDPELLKFKYQRYYVTGRLTLYGVPTDIELIIVFDPFTMQVTDFTRSDWYGEFGQFPESVSNGVNAEAALEKLRETVDMELVYCVTNSGDMAKLVYMPVDSSRYAVRISDGEVINLNALNYDNGMYRGYGMDMAAAETAGAMVEKLTEAELAGISIYEGAMSVDELDDMLRGMTELGITGDYVIHTSNYYQSDDKLMAEMYYRHELSEDEKIQRNCAGYDYNIYDTKNVTLNAVSGEIASVYTYYEGSRTEHVDIDESALIDRVAAFLGKYFDDYSVVCDENTVNAYEYSWARSLTSNLVRTHNGHPFRANTITVTVNAETGTIDELYINWSNTQEFEEPDEATLIDKYAAADAYIGAMHVEEVFAKIPGGSNAFGDTVYTLEHCWQFDNTQGAYAVDAITGQVYAGSGNANVFEYDDLDGAPYSEIAKTLGSFGIGFEGGKFNGLADFTLEDALTIIMQASSREEIKPRTLENMLGNAYEIGMPDVSGIDPDRALTKAEFVRILITMAGYGEAAELSGIFNCGFTDDAEIAADDYGYVAIAYGLGLISTDADGNIRADQPLSRAEGATIFHNLLLLD